MALFQRTNLQNPAERRAVRRHTVDCRAKLKMLGGDRDGRLSDLSEAGARFDTPNPPTEGVTCLLSWNGHEHFGKIVWANENGCGLIFERSIPMSIVLETAQAVDEPTGPIANFGNIPIAPRGRRGLVSLD